MESAGTVLKVCTGIRCWQLGEAGPAEQPSALRARHHVTSSVLLQHKTQHCIYEQRWSKTVKKKHRRATLCHSCLCSIKKKSIPVFCRSSADSPCCWRLSSRHSDTPPQWPAILCGRICSPGGAASAYCRWRSRPTGPSSPLGHTHTHSNTEHVFRYASRHIRIHSIIQSRNRTVIRRWPHVATMSLLSTVLSKNWPVMPPFVFC